MKHSLDTQIWVPQTREDVFPFFCDAWNLERITPPELNFHILTPRPIDMREGAKIHYRLKLWGVPFGWETLITLWEPPYRFVDEQVSGPFGHWVHRHEFVPTGHGTLIFDHVDYVLPLSPLGDLFHPLVRRQLLRIFRHRHLVMHGMYRPDGFTESPILIDMSPAAPKLPPAVPQADEPADEPAAQVTNHAEGWQIKLLYDAACPFCRREIHWIKRRDKTNILALEDISAPEFDAGKYGLDFETVDGAIHAILPDGSIITGMEVFRRLYATIGLGWLLAPTGWPGLRRLFDWGYKVFARNRVRLGGVVGGGRDCSDASCETRA